MTKAPTPTEMSKGQSDNTNNATKKFDYTAVADRLRTVSLSNYSHPTGVFFSDNWYNAFTKKYYFQIYCCDSIFSLLSRALEYIISTEVFGYIVVCPLKLAI